MNLLLFALGLGMLLISSQYLIEYSSRIAKKFNLNLVTFGAIILGIGTSLPELAVTVDASLKKLPDITVGNIVGSNIANIGLILGIGLLFSKLKYHAHESRKESQLMFMMSLIFAGLLYFNSLGWAIGLLLLIITGFIIKNLMSRKQHQIMRVQELKDSSVVMSIIILLASMATLALGSKLLVDASTAIAVDLGISLRLVAVSMIAIGTSLPELAVTIVAIRKKEEALAIGNIIGSNLFNITLVGGVGALLTPLNGPIRPLFLGFFLLFSSIGYLLGIEKLRPTKKIGITLLILYAVFIVSEFIELR